MQTASYGRYNKTKTSPISFVIHSIKKTIHLILGENDKLQLNKGFLKLYNNFYSTSWGFPQTLSGSGSWLIYHLRLSAHLTPTTCKHNALHFINAQFVPVCQVLFKPWIQSKNTNAKSWNIYFTFVNTGYVFYLVSLPLLMPISSIFRLACNLQRHSIHFYLSSLYLFK